MKKKSTSQNTALKFIIISIAALLFLLAGLFIFLRISTYKPSYGFYDVPEKIQMEISKILTENSKKGIDSVILDKNIPLNQQTKQIKKCQMIFVQQTSETKEFAKNNKITKPIPAEFFQELPYSIEQSVAKKDKGYSYIPLLYDFYQIDVNYSDFQEAGGKNIDLWSDLHEISKIQSELFPYSAISFAYDNDEIFLDVFGSFLESLNSSAKYNELCSALYSCNKNADKEKINEILENNPSVQNTIAAINDLVTDNVIKHNVKDLTIKDCLLMADNHLTSNYICRLSHHRQMEPKNANGYKCIFFPSVEFSDDNPRMFCAPEYSAICIKSNKNAQKLLSLLSNTKQTVLSTETGLAPVNLHCSVADRQADDVRYWLAASHGPILPLSRVFSSEENRKLLAEILKAQINL